MLAVVAPVTGRLGVAADQAFEVAHYHVGVGLAYQVRGVMGTSATARGVNDVLRDGKTRGVAPSASMISIPLVTGVRK